MWVDLQHHQAVVDKPNDERARECAQSCANASREARASDHRCSNSVELIAHARRWLSHAQSRGQQDGCQSRHHPSVHVGANQAARHIDAWLNGSKYVRQPRHDVIGYERLHLWYRTNAPQVEQERLPVERRGKDFDEVLQSLSESEALFEAKRCLSCGNCFECDGCLGACPQGAVIKLGPGKRYKFDFDRCTGCAVCYEQCPCHAIEMIDEPVTEEKSS